MTTLHLVTGVFSCINSFSTRYLEPAGGHYVVVLFTDPADQPAVYDHIFKIPGVRGVAFMNDPSNYLKILADPAQMTHFCSGNTPTHLRMFFSHSSWLLNALASAFPDTPVTLFEEGMAGLYPDNLEKIEFFDQLTRIEYHKYLGSVTPLSAVTRPELFTEIDASLFRKTLQAVFPDATSSVGSDTVVLVEQYFDQKGDVVSTKELHSLYAEATELILDKGYRVAYKPHPRHASEIYRAISQRLRKAGRPGLFLMDRRDVALERLLMAGMPAAVAAVNSTALLTVPHLLGVPSFRIEADYGLRLSKKLAAERLGQLTNHLLLSDRIAPLKDLPEAGSGIDPWTVAIGRLDSVPNPIDDPMLTSLRNSSANVTPRLTEVFQALADSPASHVSFDLFDTLVVRPGSHPSDSLVVMDQMLASRLPPMARYSNARNAAVGNLRTSDRLAHCELAEYPIDAVAGQTAALLGGGLPAEDLQQSEFDVEQATLRARGLGISLYLFARRLGKTVGIVSDTFYSAEQLLELIGPLLPEPPDFVFTSIDAGATKADGGLFDRVLLELGITADALLHLGDNPTSDITNAEARGINTIQLPATTDAAKKTRALGGQWRGLRQEKGLAITNGMVANRFFDNPFVAIPKKSVSLGTPYALGYGISGPALLAWTLWIGRQVRDLGYDQVSFLSRDGFVARAIYRKLRGFDPQLPPDTYLFASRRIAFQVFSAEPAHVAMTQFVHGLQPSNSTKTLLLTRFGTAGLRTLREPLSRAGIADLDAPLGKAKLPILYSVLAQNADALAAACAERSQAAKQYYRREMADAERPVIVDLGYSGSSQRAVMASIGRRVDGLYFTTMEHALEYSVITGARFEPWSQDRTFFTYGSVLEYLLTPTNLPECIGIGADAAPVFAAEAKGDRVNAEIQRGIRDFLHEAFETFGPQIVNLAMRPDSATHALHNFLVSPAREDAAMLLEAVQDDTVGSGGKSLTDQWKPGREALG